MPGDGEELTGPRIAGEVGQTLNEGEPVEPRQAASVIVLRDGADAPEVLLVQRTPKARFMGGVWVFPGGAVGESDADSDGAHRRAAVRELEEEAGVQLAGTDALVPFSRWITPRAVSIRFDTHFFLAELPAGQQAQVDGEECVDLRWLSPAAALAASRSGELPMVFPTIKHLEQIESFRAVGELLDYARGRTVEAVEPRVVMEGEVARILLPGDDGYDG
ncbi:MAG TPA: NUDIX hydrolase [Solirubrobacteraceae bacterium]|nr:NUDIX hydrolase [Solirubrobacteraceae bacterium]